MTGAIISIVSLLIGTVFGISFMSLCIAAKSKNVFTNADMLALDTEQLADLIYRADDINKDMCSMEYDDNDNLVNCKRQDEDNGCVRCIKEWLEKELDQGCKE